jgi:hypothetical protein
MRSITGIVVATLLYLLSTTGALADPGPPISASTASDTQVDPDHEADICIGPPISASTASDTANPAPALAAPATVSSAPSVPPSPPPAQPVSSQAVSNPAIAPQLHVQEYAQLRAEMTQMFSSERAFAATLFSAAIAILVFLLKSVLDLKLDNENIAIMRRTARAFAILGFAICAILMIVLSYAVWEWHIAIYRMGSYLRVFFEEGRQFPDRLSEGSAAWLTRSRDAGCVARDQPWLYSHSASDAIIVAMISVWFLALASAGLAFVGTRPSFQRGESKGCPIAPLSAGLVAAVVLFIFAFQAFQAADRLPLEAGIISAYFCFLVAMYRLENNDLVFYWRKHYVRSIILYSLAVVSFIAVLYNVKELALLKKVMPVIESEWRCVKAKETSDQTDQTKWCNDQSSIARQSYLGQNCP